MVIDDDQLVRSFVRRALAGEHDVTVESCGEDALARIQRGERFDVILCDVMMPQMTGLELFDLISALSPEQAKRIVFITGGAFTGGIQRVLEATGNPRLDKPFHADRLRELVGGILDARRSGRSERGGSAARDAHAAGRGDQLTLDAPEHAPRVAQPRGPRQAPRSIAAALAARRRRRIYSALSLITMWW